MYQLLPETKRPAILAGILPFNRKSIFNWHSSKKVVIFF